MATAVVAHGVARSVAPVPLYHALSHPWLRRAEKRVHEKRQRPAHPPEGAQGAGAPKTAAEPAAGPTAQPAPKPPSSADAGAPDQGL